MMLPLLLASPEFPYQIVVADYLTVKSKTRLVVTDKFSRWLSLFYHQKEALTTDLIKNLKDYFITFSIV